MQPMVMQNGRRLVVWNAEAVSRLATANEAIRRVRNRGGRMVIPAVLIDDERPVVVLGATPPEQVLNVTSGLCSQRQDDGHWLSRCMAFGIEWSWIGDAPAAQMLAPLPLPRLPAPDNVIAHPFFAAALRTAGSAS